MGETSEALPLSPTAALRYCAEPGCQARVTRGRCKVHQPQERDRRNVDVRRWYRTTRWRQLRARKFAAQPLCVDCLAEGVYELWTDLDHIEPHRGDPVLFWAEWNVEGRCHRCHSAKTARGQ